MNLELQQWKRKKTPTLFATVLKYIFGQIKEDGELSAVAEIAGSVPDIPIEYEQFLKDRGGSWNDVNRSYLPEDSVLTARREETAWALADGVHETVPM